MFEHADQFSVDRSRNPQTAFGNGVHLCLGLHLARMEIARAVCRIAAAADSRSNWPASRRTAIANFVSGLKTLPIRYQHAMKDDPRRRDLASYPWARTMETRFADMDVNRHLNNVAFSRFFEEARIRFNWDLFAARQAAASRPRYLVAHVAIDYLGEGSYPDAGDAELRHRQHRPHQLSRPIGDVPERPCIALCDTVLVHRGETARRRCPTICAPGLRLSPLRG